MRFISAIVFSIFFLLTTMQQTTLFLLYKLNEKEITEKYCVNKNIAGSCCHGKCHLNKAIAKTENENTGNPFAAFTLKIKEIEIICHQLQYTVYLNTPVITIHNGIDGFSVLEGYQTPLVKPPAVLG